MASISDTGFDKIFQQLFLSKSSVDRFAINFHSYYFSLIIFFYYNFIILLYFSLCIIFWYKLIFHKFCVILAMCKKILHNFKLNNR